MDIPSIIDVIFNDPQHYLGNFWNAVLDQSGEELSKRTVEVGRWVRINGTFMQQRTDQMLSFIFSIPSFLPRLLALLPSCSPLSDFFLRFLYLELTPRPTSNSTTPSPITYLSENHLIPLLLSMLHPSKPVEYHQVAGDLLRLVIGFENGMVSGNAAEILGLGMGVVGPGGLGIGIPPPPPQQQQMGENPQMKFQQLPFGFLGATGQVQAVEGNRVRWPGCQLSREIASERSVRRMLEMMLDDVGSEEEGEEGVVKVVRDDDESEVRIEKMDDSVVTERMPSSLGTNSSFSQISTPLGEEGESGIISIGSDGNVKERILEDGMVEVLGSSFGSSVGGGSPSGSGGGNNGLNSLEPNRTESNAPTVSYSPSIIGIGDKRISSTITPESTTSCLIQTISVIIDLIRKNNSDFVEQQILGWAQREEKAEMTKMERERILNGEGGEDLDLESGGIMVDEIDESWRDDKGPSVVDLTKMLEGVTSRMGDFQRLLRTPRSPNQSVPTTMGPIAPLTFERFRICELYAELIHCSNMGLVNRPPNWGASYDDEGHLVGGWRSAHILASVIRGDQIMEAEDAVAPQENESVEIQGDEIKRQEISEDTEGVLKHNRHPTVLDQDGLRSPAANTTEFPREDPPEVIGKEKILADTVSSESNTEGESRSLFSSDPENGTHDSAGTSTPSSSSSIDSESGILNRAEAKALEGMMASVTLEDEEAEDEADPFDEAVAAVPDEFEEETQTVMGDLESGLGNGSGTDLSQVTSNDRPSRQETRQPLKKTNSSNGTHLYPGDRLKQAFMDEKVVEVILDLFFEYPWNNFLHNVVYDIFQQIFGGPMDRGLNRWLTSSAFVHAKVVERILKGYEANEEATSRPHGVRLGYMGHMNIISDEIFKLFQHYPHIYKDVQPSIDPTDWDKFVENILRPIREQDQAHLVNMTSSQMDLAMNPNFEDESFQMPPNSSRLTAVEDSSSIEGTSVTVKANGKQSENSTSAHFARYMAQELSNDFQGGEDDDDDDSAWYSNSGLNHNDDVDLEMGRERFGFDDSFGDDDSNKKWTTFNDSFDPSSASTTSPSVPTTSNLTSADWHRDFLSKLDNPSTVDPFADIDDFGNFESGGTGEDDGDGGNNSFGDFDFNEGGFGTEFGVDTSPVLVKIQHEENNEFPIQPSSSTSTPTLNHSLPPIEIVPPPTGRQAAISPISPLPPSIHSRSVSSISSSSSQHSLSPPSSPSTETIRHPPLPSQLKHQRRRSSISSGGSSAVLAASPEEPLGPGVSPNAHITEDGKVAVKIAEGVEIRVPPDEIALAVEEEMVERASRE